MISRWSNERTGEEKTLRASACELRAARTAPVTSSRRRTSKTCSFRFNDSAALSAEIAGGAGLPRPPAADQSADIHRQKPSARHRRSQVRALSQGYALEAEAQLQDGAYLRAPSMRPTSSFLPFGDVQPGAVGGGKCRFVLRPRRRLQQQREIFR